VVRAEEPWLRHNDVRVMQMYLDEMSLTQCNKGIWH
jgi:hypothetical protein